MYSGPATTLSAQSVISSAKNFFESFLADNYNFLDSTELVHWMNKVIDEDIELDGFIKISTEIRERRRKDKRNERERSKRKNKKNNINRTTN